MTPAQAPTTSIIQKSFETPDETTHPFPLMTFAVVRIGDLTFNRETLEPGWRWSTHVKPGVKTPNCQKFHVKIFLAGRQRVVMQDGTEMEFGAGDVAVIPAGHDAWVVGDEPNVLLELSGAVKPS